MLFAIHCQWPMEFHGSSEQCPICGASPVVNETCPASCGSLEGFPPKSVKKPSRTFGYDWASGFVAPFLGIDPQAAMDALQATAVGEKDSVVDLGCGDGRICHAACLLGAMATGCDLDEALIEKAREASVSEANTPVPDFFVMDLFEVDLNPFSVITVFLLPDTTSSSRLTDKFLNALARNSRIIAFGWQIPLLGEPSSKFQSNVDDPKSSGLTKWWYIYDSTPALKGS
jgi:SAM-dependent methyltransferase